MYLSAKESSQLASSNNTFGFKQTDLVLKKHFLCIHDDWDIFTQDTVSIYSSAFALLQVDVNSFYPCYEMEELCKYVR